MLNSLRSWRLRLPTVIGLGLVLAAATFATLRVTAAIPDAKGPVPNPDAGLTDAQRDAKYAAGRSEFDAHYADWLAHLDPAKVQWAQLPHSEINSFSKAPLPDLPSAVHGADVIVVGTAKSIALEPSVSRVTVTVEEAIKGAPGGSVTVYQSGGLRPTPDWTGMVVADSPSAPTLVPGTRAVLFLQHRPEDDGYNVLPFVGTYVISDGVSAPLEYNPFADNVRGLSVAALKAAIQTAGK